MAASFDLQTLVVLGGEGDRLVIWHVNVGAALGESRLSGAWVLDSSQADEVESLTAGYTVVLAGDDAGADGTVDVAATVETVRAAIESADRRFTEHQDATGGKLVRPEWPVIVPPDEAASPRHPIDDEQILQVLTLARGIAELADAWAAFESLRLARPFLEDLGGRAARPLPLAVR
ncbi:hypothetical protein ACWDUL_37205 [Nocardia niigatensis]|uniref:hypothetical protein n=1 Tax=Nocardia niigatensis TaxID=209249 RepID=UPI0005925A3A|nr:hypothetical protein [Nocardia niigatensis]